MPGFHPVSLSQLQAADREVHVRMGELTRAGLTMGADGSLPLDGPLTQVLAGSHIQWMLMPLLAGWVLMPLWRSHSSRPRNLASPTRRRRRVMIRRLIRVHRRMRLIGQGSRAGLASLCRGPSLAVCQGMTAAITSALTTTLGNVPMLLGPARRVFMCAASRPALMQHMFSPITRPRD